MVKTTEKYKIKENEEEIRKEDGYKKIPIGGIIPQPATSKKYKTGDWKVKYPVLDEEKCIHCLFCYIYCPERCVKVKDGKVEGMDLEYCKGCGICAAECPKDAIEMKLK